MVMAARSNGCHSLAAGRIWLLRLSRSRGSSCRRFAGVLVRRARTADVPAIKALVDLYAGSGRKLLAKDLVDALRGRAGLPGRRARRRRSSAAARCTCSGPTSARSARWPCTPTTAAQRIGAAVLDALIDTARELGLSRLFALTFHTAFFARHGFVEIDGTPVDPDTYDALRRSYDPGVAEFLGLEYVKPNTLGNTRMLRISLSRGVSRAPLDPGSRGLASRAKGVSVMATIDRIEPGVHAVGAVHVAVPAIDHRRPRTYVGKHRRPGARGLRCRDVLPGQAPPPLTLDRSTAPTASGHFRVEWSRN